jgi:uncharacterized SAM-binding protein YcdF (DUF218 family)
MFFILSKTVAYLVVPSNLLIAIGLIGVILLFTRFQRLASWLIVTSLVLMVVVGYSPLGRVLLLPLENRFPPWDTSHGPPTGVVVLGGSIAADVSAARGAVVFSGGAERITAAVELARRYPDVRLIFTGGSGSLDPNAPPEAPFAVKELVALGVAHERITAEEQSRNTIENAVFSRLLADPKPGERWVLMTSAAHMPRAIGAFRAAGFPVEAYPVGWSTRGWRDAARPFESFLAGMGTTDYAVHEWLGLAVYWATGRSSALFPAP